MSKYQPIKTHLRAIRGDEAPMTFREVEAILGFSLPNSARAYPAWWSNNEGGNVASQAWLDAGWKTSRVDIGGERLVFVRNRRERPAEAKVDRPSASAFDVGALSGAGKALLEDFAARRGVGLAEAAVAFINDAAGERRRNLLDRFARLSPVVADDSADLIREDRDAG